MIPYKGNLKYKIYDIYKTRSKKSDGTYKITRRCEDIFTLDIETTSAWLTNEGKVKGYKKGKSTEYWNSLRPIALCYLWQFSFNNHVYYGRDSCV